jgi:TatA/E family protein of Tat protein translocase
MFGVGMTEIVVILVIALLIFGPNKLPELARSLGKGFGEFRRASYDLRQSLMEATEPEPPKNRPQAPRPSESRTVAGSDAVAGTSAAPPKDDPGPPASSGGA